MSNFLSFSRHNHSVYLRKRDDSLFVIINTKIFEHERIIANIALTDLHYFNSHPHYFKLQSIPSQIPQSILSEFIFVDTKRQIFVLEFDERTFRVSFSDEEWEKILELVNEK